MRRVTESTKIREGRGLGDGSKYKPWIKAREIAGEGTASTFPDYKHGREIQVLSQGEAYYYYLFRWRDDVLDIKEQYPLNKKETMELATSMHIKHPDVTLTTDLLIIKKDGTKEAYSIKDSRKVLKDKEVKDRIALEKSYWDIYKVKFEVLFKRDVNAIKVQNIMDVTKCYYLCDVQTKEDLVRHKIANKEIITDMDSDYICYKKLFPLLEQGSDDDE